MEQADKMQTSSEHPSCSVFVPFALLRWSSSWYGGSCYSHTWCQLFHREHTLDSGTGRRFCLWGLKLDVLLTDEKYQIALVGAALGSELVRLCIRDHRQGVLKTSDPASGCWGASE